MFFNRVNGKCREVLFMFRKIAFLHPKFTFLVIPVLLMCFLTGCSPCNVKAFHSCLPRDIAVVTSYDIKTKPKPSMGEVVVMGAALGGVGGALAELSKPEKPLNRADEINQIIRQNIISQLNEKNYQAQVIVSERRKYNWLENSNDKSKNVFRKLIKKYSIESEIKQFDAVLFVEYLLVLRHSKDVLIDNISLDSLEPGYRLSRIWIYDTSTSRNLYGEFITHSHKEPLEKALKGLSSLRDIPDYAEMVSSVK